MPDIFFNCSSCGKHLVVDDSGAGLSINCPDCNAPVSLPKLTLVYSCPHCTEKLKYTSSMKGQQVHCSKCGGDIQFPGTAANDARLFRSPQSTQPQKPQPTCPSCRKVVQQEASFCGNCGASLKSGTKEPPATVKTAQAPLPQSSSSHTASSVNACPQCSEQNRSDRLTCWQCGANLKSGMKERVAVSHSAPRLSSADMQQKRTTAAIIGFIIGVCVMNWGVMLVGVKAPIHEILGVFGQLDNSTSELNKLNQQYSDQVKAETGQDDSTCIPCCTAPLSICSGAGQGFLIGLLLTGGIVGACLGSAWVSRNAS